MTADRTTYQVILGPLKYAGRLMCDGELVEMEGAEAGPLITLGAIVPVGPMIEGDGSGDALPEIVLGAGQVERVFTPKSARKASQGARKPR
jgi:hypothetical protein